MKSWISIAFILYTPYLLSWEFHPILGFEQVQKVEPTPHTKTRFIYGARLLLGPKFLALEIEGTAGQDSEEFSNPSLKLKEKVYNGMLGLRSTANLFLLDAYIRAGAHIRRREIERVENNITTEETPSAYVSPYAGAGVVLGPGPVRLQAGITAIFTNRPTNGDAEYQYAIGLNLGF